MSLSCLTCQPSPGRDGDRYGGVSPGGGRCCTGLDRSLSMGSLSPPTYYNLERHRLPKAKSSVKSSIKKRGHQKKHSIDSTLINANVRTGTAMVEVVDVVPRLVRSGGMRREWSFEDLRNRGIAVQKR